MCVLFEGACREHHWSLEIAEGSIEPSHYTMNSISVLHLELVLCGKLDIILIAADQVEVEDLDSLRHQTVLINCVDQRFFHDCGR